MNKVAEYIEAATRANTVRSYESALRHYEVEWGGLLPATPDAVARYLAEHAETLSFNTLKQRLAALARWHLDQGFPDPTKASVVRQVAKGIRTLHPPVEKRARPLQIDQLQRIDDWLARGITDNDRRGCPSLRLYRDRALLLLGFWRGFRSDELIRLQVEHVVLTRGEGMTCFLPRTKGDRSLRGMTYKAPALSRLCPVSACGEWLVRSGLNQGSMFRRIDRWGHIDGDGLHLNSFIPLLRNLFRDAGVPLAEQFSAHSLRRGFAGWAAASGWDVKSLMEYVGWRDMKSALRYIDGSDDTVRRRIEAELQSSGVSGPQAVGSDSDPSPRKFGPG